MDPPARSRAQVSWAGGSGIAPSPPRGVPGGAQCRAAELGGLADVGGCEPGPGRLVFPRAWQSCFLGCLCRGCWAGLKLGSSVVGAEAERGVHPQPGHGTGEARRVPGWPSFGAERRRRMEGRRLQGVVQVMLLLPAAGARMGWEVTCPPVEEIWRWSRTRNDG